MSSLDIVLNHFNLHASTYHQGGFCGTAEYAGEKCCGYIHLLRAGRVTFEDKSKQVFQLEEPGLMMIVRPNAYRLTATQDCGAELVCATLQFDGGADNPLSRALPDYIIRPLSELPSLGGCLDWIFQEATGQQAARELVLNRLFELMVIQLLRHIMTRRELPCGLMAGLADTRLSRALTQIHQRPEQSWTVAALASIAGMSRAGFAAHFRKVVGFSPADYLLEWRVSLAQKRLREGRPITLIADEVGYESPSAMARAFRRKVGSSPRQWIQQDARPG